MKMKNMKTPNTPHPPPPKKKNKTKQNKTSHKPKARKHNNNFKLFVLPLALFVYFRQFSNLINKSKVVRRGLYSH